MSSYSNSKAEIAQSVLDTYLADDVVNTMNDYIQHGSTTTLQHCLSVVSVSYAMASRLHWKVNYQNLATGALLHDFYLYDWHTHKSKGTLHGFAHPHIACRNAADRFQINAEVQHIITTHMWPLTLRYVPRSKEAVIVCMADKYCSMLETIAGFWQTALKFCRIRRV